MTQQAAIESLTGLIVNLQKRLYALEREVHTMKVVRKPERRAK